MRRLLGVVLACLLAAGCDTGPQPAAPAPPALPGHTRPPPPAPAVPTGYLGRLPVGAPPGILLAYDGEAHLPDGTTVPVPVANGGELVGVFAVGSRLVVQTTPAGPGARDHRDWLLTEVRSGAHAVSGWYGTPLHRDPDTGALVAGDDAGAVVRIHPRTAKVRVTDRGTYVEPLAILDGQTVGMSSRGKDRVVGDLPGLRGLERLDIVDLELGVAVGRRRGAHFAERSVGLDLGLGVEVFSSDRWWLRSQSDDGQRFAATASATGGEFGRLEWTVLRLRAYGAPLQRVAPVLTTTEYAPPFVLGG